MQKSLILYVDDDQANLDVFKRTFRFDYQIETASSGHEGLARIKGLLDLAVIISDQRMPQMTGVQFLKEASRINPYAQRVMLTAFTDNEALLAAIQEGHVYDYVVKPWEKEALKKIIDKAIEIYNDRIEKIKQLKVVESKNKILEEELKSSFHFSEIIGSESGLKTIGDQIQKIAPTQSSVLIRGESGTGKELIARAIHAHSPRCSGPFIKVNCAALSPHLLESELFGHEKGAFTGAVAQKLGRFEMAHGGTLFLDEVGDLPEPVQVKILRVLQEREFERVGGAQTIKVDLRLIGATHQNLEKLIQENRFRQDLFFRMNVIPLIVPPLRERSEDIPLLVDYFIQKFSQEIGKKIHLTEEAIKALVEYDWPGNVRELSNVIERAVVLADNSQITATDLAQNLISTTRLVREVQERKFEDIRQDIHEEEAKVLAQALKQHRGNISALSRELGLPRSTVVHRLRRVGLL